MEHSVSSLVYLATVSGSSSLVLLFLSLTIRRYAGYPYSVLGNNRIPSGVLPGAATKSEEQAGLTPVRSAAHIKIESPSVAAAAKKAAAEKVGIESPEPESSTASDEDTLIGRTKSSKSYGADEVVLSPTKSKL